MRFVDLSPKHDGKFTVTAQVPASAQGAAAQSVAIKPVKQGGMWVFKLKGNRQNANRSLAFSVAGSKFRLVLDGTSVLNGAGVTGRVTLMGRERSPSTVRPRRSSGRSAPQAHPSDEDRGAPEAAGHHDHGDHDHHHDHRHDDNVVMAGSPGRARIDPLQSVA